MAIPAPPGNRATALMDPNPHYSVRREKALCVSQVQVLSGESSGHPSSYRGSRKGNRSTEALGTEAFVMGGWQADGPQHV